VTVVAVALNRATIADTSAARPTHRLTTPWSTAPCRASAAPGSAGSGVGSLSPPPAPVDIEEVSRPTQGDLRAGVRVLPAVHHHINPATRWTAVVRSPILLEDQSPAPSVWCSICVRRCWSVVGSMIRCHRRRGDAVRLPCCPRLTDLVWSATRVAWTRT